MHKQFRAIFFLEFLKFWFGIRVQVLAKTTTMKQIQHQKKEIKKNQRVLRFQLVGVLVPFFIFFFQRKSSVFNIFKHLKVN